MAGKRINVLVYSDDGASRSAVRHTLTSLRLLLEPHYAVLPLTSAQLLSEPWSRTCALLVFPGGGDLGYCRVLNGVGNRIIKQYVSTGGAYLGLCAGGYYGAAKCEFEVGNESLEVIGDRELAFFPGICRGSAFGEFTYNSEKGTRAVELLVSRSTLAKSGLVPEKFHCYCNGGGVFVDAWKFQSRGIEVLASYGQKTRVDPGDSSAAAVVFCPIEKGAVILMGPHPEFIGTSLSDKARDMDSAVVETLRASDSARADFLRACLRKLDLTVNDTDQDSPSLTPILVSSAQNGVIEKVFESLKGSTTMVDGEDYAKGENDTFKIQKQEGTWSMTKLTRAALGAMQANITIRESDVSQNDKKEQQKQRSDNPLDDIVKTIVFCDHRLPTSSETSYFSHSVYYNWLQQYRQTTDTSSIAGLGKQTFGDPLLYAETTTSTSSILERNPLLSSQLPSGSTLIATRQLAGRGRGTNVWVSPAGSLMFSTIFTHPLSGNEKSPVVFVQYLAAIAIAEGIRNYGENAAASGSEGRRAPQANPYTAFSRCIRLKWPNDIYALDPTSSASIPKERRSNSSNEPLSDGERARYAKIGGILVHTSYAGGDFTVTLGIGLNVSNAGPTTSLNALLEAWNASMSEVPLEPFIPERLLPRILTTFESLYSLFLERGFNGSLEQLYYLHWLHGRQIVTLEEEGAARARIKGLTRDWGLLAVEEVRQDARQESGWASTGKSFALQSDSNSFDFWKGLVKRKI